MNKITGWDVGGAHLKAVTIDQSGQVLDAVQIACPLWQGLDKLRQAVNMVLERGACHIARHAVTMTGELADIFIDREQGVCEISALMSSMLKGELLLYAATHGLKDAAVVKQHHEAIASANWHASATYLARAQHEGMLIDIGSTTCDMIAFRDGHLLNQGLSDAGRMRTGELVYTGVVRTPLMALCQRIAFQGEECYVAAEHFATTADIYRITGELAEHDDMADTADGQDKSINASMRRLARMVGHDKEDAPDASWQALAHAFKTRQLDLLAHAATLHYTRTQLDRHSPILSAGCGAFLVNQLAKRLNRDVLPVSAFIRATSDELRAEAAVCFPAYAVASLVLA